MDAFDLSALNTGAVAPELTLIVTLLVILIADLIWGATANRAYPLIGLVGCGAAVTLLAFQWNLADPVAFFGSFTADPISILFRGMVIISAAVTILMSIRYLGISNAAAPEFYVLLLTSTLGGSLLAGSTDLVMVFIALETLSIASYLMAGYAKRDPRSNEAALKYLLIGASSTAIFLYGMSLLYGLSGGQTQMAALAPALTNSGLASILALVFCLTGIGFKLATVPFHQWTPDVYEGSPTPVVAFLSVGSKAAGFALALRFLATVFPALTSEWQAIFTVFAILTMVLGNVVAIAQTNLKRMLAYSSIAQAGFVMIGLVVGTEAGYASMIFYLLIYLFMNLGAFLCLTLFALKTGTDEITAYSGLYQKDPFLTLCLSLCLLSLAGIPPLAGFFGKIYLFWAGWQAEAYGLVITGLVTSVISIYYYVRVVKMMVVKEPHEMSDAVKAYEATNWSLPGFRPLQLGMVLTLVITVLAGILSNPIFNLTADAVTKSAFLSFPQVEIVASAPLDNVTEVVHR